jgi:hypothetical protein
MRADMVELVAEGLAIRRRFGGFGKLSHMI